MILGRCLFGPPRSRCTRRSAEATVPGESYGRRRDGRWSRRDEALEGTGVCECGQLVACGQNLILFSRRTSLLPCGCCGGPRSRTTVSADVVFPNVMYEPRFWSFNTGRVTSRLHVSIAFPDVKRYMIRWRAMSPLRPGYKCEGAQGQGGWGPARQLTMW